MLDEFLVEQPVATTILKNIISKKKLVHAYLFETGTYYKGLDFALSFAKMILCPKKQKSKEICEKCTQCTRIDNNNFTELEIIEPDGLWIKKEQLDNLQKNFRTKSIEGFRKVYIINHAEQLNTSAANSILKFLEEPEENIIAILVTNNAYSLLDTIVSRCQIIKLNEVNNVHENSLYQKISRYLFNSQIEIEKFIEHHEENSIIDEVLLFIKVIETEKKDALLKEKSLCSNFLKDKTVFNQFLNISILFYKDCLEYLIKNKTSIFDINKSEISFVLKNNDSSKILQKIEILTKMQERIQYNCNLNLILDKLIILLGGI